MLFNSFSFLLFFPLVVIVYFAVPIKLRSHWLLGASYIFCMTWDIRAGAVLLLMTLVSYLGGIILERVAENGKSGRGRTVCFVVFLILLLLPLLRCKFIGLFMRGYMERAGISLVMPLGLSFYTLQAIGYLADVYRGKEHAEKKLVRYALFLAFFPKFVSGPFERSGSFMKQITDVNNARFEESRVKNGIILMMWGYFQKMIIADKLTILVEEIYGNWNFYSGTIIAAGTVIFAIQLYADFAGYSNIAAGAAQILGYRLCDNFRQPYLAVNVKDFWRRWHISLSSWLRDYVYIPTGGNRKGKRRKHINLLITFLISGLWHGTSWGFVAWGGLHGVYQIVGELYQPMRDKILDRFRINRNHWLYRGGQRIVVFLLVDIAWLLFRADGYKTALKMLKKCFLDVELRNLVDGKFLYMGLSGIELIVVGIALITLLSVDLLHEKDVHIRKWLSGKSVVSRWMCYIAMFCILVIAALGQIGVDASQFIYAQF